MIFGDGLGEDIGDAASEFERKGVKYIDRVGEEGQDAGEFEASDDAPLINKWCSGLPMLTWKSAVSGSRGEPQRS